MDDSLDADEFKDKYKWDSWPKTVKRHWRDVYHYAMILEEESRPSVLLVADDGFESHVANAGLDGRIEIHSVKESCHMSECWKRK
jgi:hypothetical protein